MALRKADSAMDSALKQASCSSCPLDRSRPFTYTCYRERGSISIDA
jgi:hypothetical protein